MIGKLILLATCLLLADDANALRIPHPLSLASFYCCFGWSSYGLPCSIVIILVWWHPLTLPRRWLTFSACSTCEAVILCTILKMVYIYMYIFVFPSRILLALFSLYVCMKFYVRRLGSTKGTRAGAEGAVGVRGTRTRALVWCVLLCTKRRHRASITCTADVTNTITLCVWLCRE